MTRHLNRTVLVGGSVLPAGTVWSQALASVPDRFWGGEDAPVVQAPQEPPRSGRGSGVDAWRRYAESIGTPVPEGASRDEIVAAVDARG